MRTGFSPTVRMKPVRTFVFHYLTTHFVLRGAGTVVIGPTGYCSFERFLFSTRAGS
jgi:hypothetical protein